MSLPQDTDVLIVGAGMAGVTTAWALRQVGIRSIVLEAQDRIGGRIQTSRKWKKIPCDMGAGWVSHPTINPLIKIARKKKIDLRPSDLSKIAIHDYSNAEIDDLWVLYGAAYAGVKLVAECRRDEGKRDIGLSPVLPGVLDAMNLDPKTRRGIEFFIDTSITQAYAAEQKNLSLYNCDDNYTELFLGLWIVPDGYIRFVEMLKKGLDIRTEHVVCEIDRDEQGVFVKIRSHGEFRAPYAVVTVPHGVLAKGHIKFTPCLPPWKQEAIDRVRTGLSDKFWFHFPRKFWKSKRDVVGRADPEGKWSLWLNFEKYHDNEPVLLAFNRTKYAAKLEKMSDDAVVAEAMAALRKEYGRRTPDPIAMQRSTWGTNEFAEGTITHLPPGASAEDYRTLGKPVGRLRFAGDSTCPEFNLQVIGAFWSGVREAERVTSDMLMSRRGPKSARV
jgi:monoamine oxidase